MDFTLYQKTWITNAQFVQGQADGYTFEILTDALPDGSLEVRAIEYTEPPPLGAAPEAAPMITTRRVNRGR